ncbi:hypothetical protein [Henriciella sp.]|uniref:hypothetical protein n=1 Tax=Henriciella sp. TaxID=1968823 RepID=UPI000C0CC140|nr:hypothetical protein [Henriciella sp.]PHR83118.1 MAG: hypothetical protein COA64_00235 [Henriciella sp.]
MNYKKTPAHEAHDLMTKEGLSQKEAGVRMGRTGSAVAGLKKRYLTTLRNEDRDLEILRLNDQGLSAREISDKLDVAVRHVRQFLTGALADD